MGQQQLLLIILGVIIVAITISTGIYIFNMTSIASNKDDLISDLNTVGQDAFAYFQRAKIMGGGNGSFNGWTVPAAYQTNPHGDITATIAGNGSTITFLSTSKDGFGTISATLDSRGQLSLFIYTGQFQ
ncbi:MAG: hypothetical protein ACHQQQ_01590 [Bacteroidota bacterium]